MDGDPKDPAAYLRAIETVVPIELEALSYHHCAFVRARVAGRSTRPHVLKRLVSDREPAVVANVIDNPHCPHDLVAALSKKLLRSKEEYHLAWYMAIQHAFTPHWIRAGLKKKEEARRIQIKKKLSLPIPPPLLPPKAPPLSNAAQRRLMLKMLKIEPGVRPARLTKAGALFYREFKSKLVVKALAKYLRHMRYLKRRRKKRRTKK